MKFPDHIVGPIFEKGDLVTFSFDDAILTFRAPIVPKNTRTVDFISSETDFRNADTSDWDQFGDHGGMTRVLAQNWDYEDAITHDDIAHVFLEIDILHYKEDQAKNGFLLSGVSLRSHFMREIGKLYSEEELNVSSGWPSPENGFFAKTIEHTLIPGLQVQVDLGGGEKMAVPCAYFSLGRRYCLGISFHFGSLHYPDRVNPYSEELLRQFRDDAFNDFLSHIHIEYTADTVALIERMNRDPNSVSEKELLG